jgi:lipopolysaccharide export system protein LptC
MIACGLESYKGKGMDMHKTLHMPKISMPVRRYTRRVSFLRAFLWVLVTATIGMVVWIASDNTSGENAIRVVFSHIPKRDAMQNIMMKPHYQGVDAHNQPYTVIAQKAIQLDKENVSLESVRGDMTMGNGAWMAVNSGTGKINITTKRLDLHKQVNMFYEGGYEFRSDYAHIDMDKGTAYGNLPVEGQGPPGTLTADSFSVSGRGEKIRFQGNVKMRLYR